MTRAALAQIDLSALRHNVKLARRVKPACGHCSTAQCVAVIKANAYGHGLLEVARSLHGQVDALAVVSLDEARALREGNIEGPILLLQGCLDADEWRLAQQLDLDVVIHSQVQVDGLSNVKADAGLRVWLKVNTGMNRLGLAEADIANAVERLKGHSGVARWILMSHFANADDPRDPMTDRQLARFEQIRKQHAPDGASIANSAGVLHWPGSHYQYLRPGIMLYGISPFIDQSAASLGLRVVMTLSASIVAVYALSRGEAVGYGQLWRAQRDSRYAVVAIGYGDGYPRLAPAGTPVLVNGQRVPLIGRVSMDSVLIDVTDLPAATVKAGDRAILWGEGLPVEEVAAAVGTIAYEMVASLSPRIRYHYKAMSGHEGATSEIEGPV